MLISRLRALSEHLEEFSIELENSSRKRTLMSETDFPDDYQSPPMMLISLAYGDLTKRSATEDVFREESGNGVYLDTSTISEKSMSEDGGKALASMVFRIRGPSMRIYDLRQQLDESSFGCSCR